MMLKNSIYIMNTIHNRLSPKRHVFKYNFLWFCIDLKKIPQNLLLSHNKFNIFSFNDNDYFQTIDYYKDNLFDRISYYAKTQDDSLEINKIYLLSQLRTFGFLFNPISLFYCFDSANNIECIIAEVENTFRERKLYYIPKSMQTELSKNFYVSPFFELDTIFKFKLEIPNTRFKFSIQNYKNNKKIFSASCIGNQHELNLKNLFINIVLLPLSPLKVLIAIHYEAFKLMLKKITFYQKDENEHLQINYLQNKKFKDFIRNRGQNNDIAARII